MAAPPTSPHPLASPQYLADVAIASLCVTHAEEADYAPMFAGLMFVLTVLAGITHLR